MMLLVALALLLFAVSLWWLSRPLRTAPAAIVAGERGDLESLRDRLIAQLNELDTERADRGIDATTGREEELRLSAELAGVLKRLEGLSPSTGAAVNGAARRAGWPVVVSLSAVLVLGAGLYLWMNAANLQGFVQAARSGVDNKRLPPLVFEMVSKLEQRLAEQPNDPDGWARLGRSYVVLEQHDKARDAYAKAYAQAPDKVEILADYAWLVFNNNPDDITGPALTLYSRLHKLAPDHPDGLWYMGFAAYQQGEFRKALTYWERLLKLLPAEDPGRQQLEQAMASAREKLRSGR